MHTVRMTARQETVLKMRINPSSALPIWEAVANVPSLAATAHSITVPLRRYESHGPFAKVASDGAQSFD